MLAIVMWKYKQVASAKALLLKIEACLNYAMASYTSVTHVIFDLDGTIIDSEKVYKAKYEELLARYGKQLSPETRLACLGRKDIDCAEAIINATNIPLTPQEFCNEVRKLNVDGMLNVELMPGVERLVNHLYQCKVPIAIATSSSKENVAMKLTKHQALAAKFQHMVMAGSDPEVKRGKPQPDVFLVCASRFPDNPSPQKCLVIEDAPSGVKGAIAASMQVLLVPPPFLPLELTQDATLVLSSLQDFKPEVFGLPKFSD